MAIYDRDYVFRNSAGGRGRPGGISANAALIIINLVIFAIEFILVNSNKPDLLFYYGHFSTAQMLKLEFWRALTFQFLHASPGHVLMNMLGLWVFGQFVEAYLGRSRYLALYLTSGVAGAVLYMLLNAAAYVASSYGFNSLPLLIYNSAATPLVGASAGVFGVTMAAAYVAPNQVLQLIFPPVPVRVKVLAYVYLAIAFINLFFGGNNAGGDAGHVGGALAGAVLIRNAHLLRDFFDVFNDSRKPKSAKRREESRASATDQEVDRVLAKVRDKGLASLSNREKRILQDATDSKRDSAR